MTWTNNFSKTFLIFASLIPFFWLIIPEKCFYQWILCHNFVYMKKFPWFLSFELGARQACDRRHRTMGTVHSGKISHLTWTFTKKYWAVLGCTGLYWAVLGHLRYLLGNVQVKWRILPLCNVWPVQCVPNECPVTGCNICNTVPGPESAGLLTSALWWWSGLDQVTWAVNAVVIRQADVMVMADLRCSEYLQEL